MAMVTYDILSTNGSNGPINNWNLFPNRMDDHRKAERQVNFLQLDIFRFDPRDFVR